MQSNTTILACFDATGDFDIEAYVKLRSKRNAATAEEIAQICFEMAAEEENRKEPRIRTKDIRGQMPKKVDALGNIVPIEPQETLWWSIITTE